MQTKNPRPPTPIPAGRSEDTRAKTRVKAGVLTDKVISLLDLESSERRSLIQALDAYESNPTGPGTGLLLKRIRKMVSGMQEQDASLILDSIERLRTSDTSGKAVDTLELLQGKVEAWMPMPAQEPVIQEPAEAQEPKPALSPQEPVDTQEPKPVLSPQEQASLNKQLIDAVYNQDVARAGELLDAGAEVDTYTPGDGPLLIAAARLDDADMVRLLISHNADVNARGVFDMTALMDAANQGRIEVMKLLIPKADLEAKDENRNTALCYTVSASGLGFDSQKQMEAASLLLSAGADINSGVGEGFTPLMHAIIGDNRDIFDFIISKEADVNAKGYRGATPLMVAAEHDKTDYIDELISRKAEVNARDDFGRTPLMHAVWDGHYEAVKLLAFRGADIDAETEDGENALKIAYAHAGFGDEDSPLRIAYADIIDFLKPHSKKDVGRYKKLKPVIRYPDQTNAVSGVTICLSDRVENMTPQERSELGIELCKAAYEGDANRIYNLLECGVSVDSKDAKNNSALFFALDNVHLEVAELLINRGATITLGLQEKLNHSLRVAAHNGDTTKMEKLIAMGADVNARDNNGRSALFFALDQVHLEVAELLISRGATITLGLQEKLNLQLLHAVYGGEAEKVKKLIAMGADVNATDSDERSSLWFASQKGHFEVVQILLDNKADPNIASEDGTTPLMAALVSGHFNIAKLLKKHGAKGPSIWFYRLRRKAFLISLYFVMAAGLGAAGYCLYQFKRNQDIQNARQTVDALYKKKGTPALIKTLESEDAYVRAQAAFVLGGIKEKNAFRPLLKKLYYDEEHVQNAAAYAIGHIVRKHPNVNALPAITSLIGMLSGENEDLWTNSSFALSEISARNPRDHGLLGAIPLFAERTNAEEIKVRKNVTWLLSRISRTDPRNSRFHRAIPALARRLRDEDRWIRTTSFWTISFLAKENPRIPELQSAVPALVGVLKELAKDKDYHVRRDACNAIRDIAKTVGRRKIMEPAIQPLEDVQKDKSDMCAVRAARSALETINKLQ